WIERPKGLIRRWLCLWGPPLALAALWFAGPGKWERLWLYSRAQGNQPQTDLWFYPVSLLRHYAAGPLMAGAIVLGLAYSLRHWRRYAERALVCYLLVGVVAVTAVPQKEIRFLETIAPVSYVLAGAALAGLLETASRFAITNRRRWAVIVSVVGL